MKRMIVMLSLAVALFANDMIIKESHCSVDATINNIIDAPKLVQKLNKALDDITTKAGQCKRD
ncbi:hypothetical protein [Sulfurimonas indica]|uniref:hypothetical protein n=2 Tax=Sulfurimonas TaxID=202746 RepID=UPI001264FDC8